jgi:hypothetical protein
MCRTWYGTFPYISEGVGCSSTLVTALFFPTKMISQLRCANFFRTHLDDPEGERYSSNDNAYGLLSKYFPRINRVFQASALGLSLTSAALGGRLA